MLRSFLRSSVVCFRSTSLHAPSNLSSLLSFRTNPGVQGKVRFTAVISRVCVSEALKDKPVVPFNIRHMSLESSSQPVELLNGLEDEFGGVIVDMKDPLDPAIFLTTLRASMSKWRLEGKRGVWLKLPFELANLVEAAVKEGFWYHHAEANYLMLVQWIPETPHTIPANASHRVGVCACVINDKREMLVVQEKSGKFQGLGSWKFPTGVVNEDEDIRRAAVREVKEETGIDAEFVEVLAFRQSHQTFFGKSDIFFVCMLRPSSFDIQKQVETEAAQWMPIEDYAAQPFVQNHNLAKFLADICIAKINRAYTGFSSVLTTSPFSEKPLKLYLNHEDLKQPQQSFEHLWKRV